MRPKDMPADYKPVRIKVAGSGGGGLMDMMGAMMSPFAMLMGGTSTDPDGAMLMTVADVNWTKGDIIKVQGKDFLVTYKWNLDLAQMAAEDKGKDPAVAKSDAIKAMELSLALLAVDGMTSISPVTNFTRDDLVKFLDKPFVPAVQESTPFDETRPQATDAPAPPEGTSEQMQGLSHAKQAGLGLMIYLADYDDVFPYAQSTKAVQYVTYPYVKTMDVWKTQNPQGSQLLYNISLGGSSATEIESPSATVMFYESRPWSDGRRIVVFADGHVRLCDSGTWEEHKATLGLKLRKVAKPLPLNHGMDWNPGG